MTILNSYGLVVSVIAKASKEKTTTEQGQLKCLYIDIDSVSMPCVGTYDGRDDGGNYSIKV